VLAAIRIGLTNRQCFIIIRRAMPKQESDEQNVDYVLEVGVEAKNAEDALAKWRKEGVVISVIVNRRPPPGRQLQPFQMVPAEQPRVAPQSGGNLPHDVGLPQKKKR
jgi:hypothetical protein